jgi:hypothetical protein
MSPAAKRRLPPDEVEHNREFFLRALRSGQFTKGTTRSDERGRPVIETDADEGCCACALMCDLFFVYDGVRSDRNYLRALNLTPRQCGFIQRDLNDSPLSFAEIADRIEREVFGAP